MRLSLLLEKQASSNAGEVTVQLIRNLKVSVSTTTIIDTIESHPDYPSLFCISDSLNRWKIDNAAFEVPPEKLEHLPVPFIAHMKSKGGQFKLVKTVTSKHVAYLDESGKEKLTSFASFISGWSGAVLLAESFPLSGEKNYTPLRRKEIAEKIRTLFIVFTPLFLVILFAINTFQYANILTILPSIFLLVKLAGVFISVLLLWIESNKQNPALKQFCTGGTKANCSAVLISKGSKLFGLISWSDIGFYYFAGGFLFLLTNVSNPARSLGPLALFNLVALPYVIFSILYQWRVVKQWCRLCLIVQGLIVVEAIVSYFSFWQLDIVWLGNYGTVLICITSFIIPMIFLSVVKPLLHMQQVSDRYRKETLKFKYNEQLFQQLLRANKSPAIASEGLGIILGNPTGKNTLIKVCNPYCGPCAKAHLAINELLRNNDDLKVQIIFTSTNDPSDYKMPPVNHLIAIAEKENVTLTEAALNNWYGAANKDYKVFAQKYPMNGELSRQSEKLQAMDKWCKEMKISFTPTFFVNGYQLPDMFSIEDLQYLLH